MKLAIRNLRRKRKNRVTLIVGIISKDAIVLAADSQTTKNPAKLLGTNKISSVEFANGTVAVAESGSADLSNAAIKIFQQLAKGKPIEDESTVTKTCEMAVREVLGGITKHLNSSSTDQERQDFLFDEVNYFELVIAYYYGFRPCLCLIRSAWCIPIPAKSYFLTSGIASDLANYVLKDYTVPDMSSTLASAMAIKTVKDAIDHVEGCGMPIRVANVTKPYRQRSFKVVGGKRVYGEIETVPSGIRIYEPLKVDGIVEIISKLEKRTHNSRNKALHKALQAQSDAYFKKLQKEWEKVWKKDPEFAAKCEAELARTAKAYEVIPDDDLPEASK